MNRIARDVLPQGGSLLAAKVSRYAVDLNRPDDDMPLYQTATTGLISTIDFDGKPLYRAGLEPDVQMRTARVTSYWRPYHAALSAEIARIRASHGYCLLLDLHSIRSHVPRLFEGRLPDLNLGTNSGASCADVLSDAAFAALQKTEFSAVRNGRFKGAISHGITVPPPRACTPCKSRSRRIAICWNAAPGPICPKRRSG